MVRIPLAAAQYASILHSMHKTSQKNQPDLANEDSGRSSPYDRDAPDEADLWFLPPDDDPPFDTGLAPLPRADRRDLFAVADWRQAQGDQSAELAGLAVRFGALDERLATLGKGLRQRLALREATDLSWWSGGRIGGERLALWVGSHLGGAGDDGQALVQAGWAVRRLTSGHGLGKSSWHDEIPAFLGRSDPGTMLSKDDIEDIADVMEATRSLHPVTRAAVLFHAWRITGQGPARDMEAAVMAACHGAGMGRGNAPFLPLSGAGALALRTSGSAHVKLAAWIDGAHQATLSAYAQLDRLMDWQAKANAAVSDLSGRTPRRLVDLLVAWPIVSAPMAEAQTDVSRAAIQRNLEIMKARGLVREITGHARYRVWMALA